VVFAWLAALIKHRLQIHVGFKGVSEPIEQYFALTAVMGLLFIKQRQPLVGPQLI
jgi:hypothetical protein